MKLTDPVTNLSGVGTQTARGLERLGITTIGELLFHLPSRLEDRSKLVAINELRAGQDCVIKGSIEKVYSRRTKRGSLLIEARLRDKTGTIAAVWFNQRYLLNQLKVGEELLLFGSKKIAPALGNPFTVKQIIGQAEITPIYPSTRGVSQNMLRKLISQALPALSDINEALPDALRQRFHLQKRTVALAGAHQPKDLTALSQARALLAVEELIGLAIAVLMSRQKRRQERAEKMMIDTDALRHFVARLPFTLTAGQRRAAWEIIRGMAEGYPANRLLYGEVGSGKTVVALLAAIAAIRSGKRAIFLVPTTTLADQQFERLRQFVRDDYSVGLITATQKGDRGSDIIVGTHALLNQADSFEDVGLIIIDEQQRFGVRQRQKLLEHHRHAHLLMTTATPIPRSLAQTLFGNLEITYLNDKPAQQMPVQTKRFGPEQRDSVLTEVRRRIGRGEPGFVICPAIVEASVVAEMLFGEEKKSVAKEAKRLREEIPGARIAAMHGKLKEVEKQKIMAAFAAGEIDVLVATTVVEVGIDNKAASWIIVENAEMFGLSSLHQLRGRVGRGAKQSVCFLSEPLDNELASKRLKALENSNNGLELSELDLTLRGPGEILGSEQSGLPDLRYADLSNHELIKDVFEEAAKIVEDGVDKSLQELIRNVDGLAAS